MKRQPGQAVAPLQGRSNGGFRPIPVRAVRAAGPNRSQDTRTVRKTGGPASMTRELVAHNKPVFDQLHPNIYRTAVGLVVWFAVAAWILFDRRSDIELPLIMVSVLLLMAVLVPWSLSLVWKKYEWPHQAHPHKTAFRDWKEADFAVWGSKLHGMHAAIDMLLPFAAMAFGLTAIGVVFLICASAAS
jgi:hypothetical protein